MVNQYLKKLIGFVITYKYLIIFWLFARVFVFSIRLDTDHSIFYYIANSLREGGTLYLSAWDHKPPTIFLLALPFTYLGPNYYLHRVVYSLLNLIATVLFFQFSQRFLSQQTTLTEAKIKSSSYFATVVFIIFALVAGVDGNNNEIWGVTIFMFILQINQLKDAQLSKTKFGLKYFLYSVLITLKPNFLIFILFELPQIFVRKNFWPANLARGALVLVLPVIYTIVFALNGHLYELWNAAIKFSAGYVAMHNKYFDTYELKNMIFVSCVVAFFYLGLYKLWPMAKSKLNLAIIGVMVAIYYVYYLFSGTHYDYYILVLAAFLALVMGSLVVTSRRVGYVIIASLVIYISSMYISTIFIQNNQSTWYPVADQDLFSVAEYIKTHKKAGDTCVYFGPTSTLNVFAQCPSPSRFINMTNYMHDIESGMNNGYLDEFVKDINTKKPRYLVVSALYQYYKYDSRVEKIYNSTRFLYQQGGLEVREFIW